MKNIDFTKWETWGHGLFAAVISSGATTGAALLSSAVSGKGIDWRQLGLSIGVSSLIAAFFYLKTAPLPDSGTVTITIPPATETKTSVNVTTTPKS
jgi:hypothetical protein